MHDLHQPREIRAIEFGRGVVEQQGRAARPFLLLNFELGEHQCGRHEFLLAARDMVFRRPAVDLYDDVTAMRAGLRRAIAPIPLPVRFQRLEKRCGRNPSRG